MNQPGLKTFDDAIDKFQGYLMEARREVVSAMRKDLGVAKGTGSGDRLSSSNGNDLRADGCAGHGRR
jgi:hypothetical protein